MKSWENVVYKLLAKERSVDMKASTDLPRSREVFCESLMPRF